MKNPPWLPLAKRKYSNCLAWHSQGWVIARSAGSGFESRLHRLLAVWTLNEPFPISRLWLPPCKMELKIVPTSGFYGLNSGLYLEFHSGSHQILRPADCHRTRAARGPVPETTTFNILSGFPVVEGGWEIWSLLHLFFLKQSLAWGTLRILIRVKMYGRWGDGPSLSNRLPSPKSSSLHWHLKIMYHVAGSWPNLHKHTWKRKKTQL